MTISRRRDNGCLVKIVVTVKQVPDPNATTVLAADNTVARDREVVLDPGDECGESKKGCSSRKPTAAR